AIDCKSRISESSLRTSLRRPFSGFNLRFRIMIVRSRMSWSRSRDKSSPRLYRVTAAMLSARASSSRAAYARIVRRKSRLTESSSSVSIVTGETSRCGFLCRCFFRFTDCECATKKPAVALYPRRASVNLTTTDSFDRYKSNLRHDFLTTRAHGKIDEILGQATGVAVSVVKRGAPIRIAVRLHTFGRGQCAIDRHCSGTTGFQISHADITDAVWIFHHLSGDLFVAGHLLRTAGVITFLHRQLLEIRVGARRSVTSVDGDLTARSADGAPIRHVTGEDLFHLLFR